jgi:hypothetical protein
MPIQSHFSLSKKCCFKPRKMTSKKLALKSRSAIILTLEGISMQKSQFVVFQTDEFQFLCILESVWLDLLNSLTKSEKMCYVREFREDFSRD